MKRILSPVISNFPLFIISILLQGALDIAYHQYLFHEVTNTQILTCFEEIIFVSYLICLSSYLLRKFHLKVFFYILLFLIYATGCYLLYAYSMDIAPNILLLLFETNPKEVTGFFQTFLLTPPMFKTLFVVGTFAALAIIGEYFNKRITNIVSKPVFTGIIGLILLVGAYGSIGTIARYWELSQCKKAYDAEFWTRTYKYYKGMPVPNLLYSITAIRLAGEDLNYMIEATKKSLETVQPIEGDSLNIVLVIGESYNKYHAGLYGYYLDTTPFQSEEQKNGNLYAFTHVKAPYNMTSIVLKNMFSCNNTHEGERWHDHPFFPAIFKKAGYKVWLWDNQYQTGQDMPWNFTLNSIIFNEQIEQLSYTAINENCYTYDDDLITDFEKGQMRKMGSHNLVIFHLYGQHIPANLQFPQDKEHQIYTIKDIKDTASYLNDGSRQEMADYANATHYNDEVIKHITNTFQDSNTIIIYFSDHGEEVYDYRDYYGRTFGEELNTPQLIKYQLEVPFTIWASDKWKEKHRPEWETMKEAVDRAFTTDNICHLLFQLAGIKTREYKPTLDLLSPDFIPQTKESDILSL